VVGLDDVTHEPMVISERNPETQQVDRELQKLIRLAVSRLGATAAEMFVLRYYEGHDNREIAKIMGTSQMVVGVVLHRARTKLRREIGHYLEKHHE
jgi:RNA polymerase sigma-70 factor (ECF subfamily)